MAEMIKELDPTRRGAQVNLGIQENPDLKRDRIILYNLYEALRKDGWNEQLLWETVNAILEKEKQR